jgi:hypothetical protein
VEGVIRRSPKITLSRCVSGEGKLRRTESARHRSDVRDRSRPYSLSEQQPEQEPGEAEFLKTIDIVLSVSYNDES